MEQEICDFLERDMERCLRDGVESAIFHKARNNLSLKRIANEASININQLLQRAKEEFMQTDREEIKGKIWELEELYSANEVMEQIRNVVGLRFLAAFRNKLQEEILGTLEAFQQGGSVEVEEHADQLLEALKGWFERAAEQSKKKFQEPILNLVKEDIQDLQSLYLEREALKAKFQPYVT